MSDISGVRILYICNEDRATTKQRLLALEDLGIQPDIVFTYRIDEKISLPVRIKRAISFRLGFFPERNNENKAVRKKVQDNPYDIVFVEKGLSIKPSTLRSIKKNQPGAKIISYTLDDVMNPQNSSWYFKKSIELYDLHFTNKRYNVEELRSMGARNVYYFRNAFSTHVHRPVSVTAEEMKHFGADVSFIGTYESHRTELLKLIAEKGIKIKVWGWIRSAASSGMVHPNITLQPECIYDDDYAKVICASKINLCFLRKINRDQETTRSIEIPACGGFMLAERTKEHQQLFEEGKEADFFDSPDELLNKIQFYLQHDDRRAAVAEAGLKKCHEQDYSYQGQLKWIIKKTIDEKTGDR